MTNQIVVNLFLNEQRREGKSGLSLSAYATDLKQFSFFLSSAAFSSLSPAGLKTVCQKWIAGLSSNAAARKLTTLRSFLKWSFQKGYVRKDLATGVFRPKRKTVTAAKPLTASQIARLRRTATIQERLLMELILQTGMRLPEVLAIKMKHLRRSDVVRLPARQGGRMVRKSEDDAVEWSEIRLSDIRYPISGVLRQALEYYLAAVTRGPRSYLLVSPRTGRPPGVRAAGMMLAKLGKRAGVRGVNPRNLRATLRSVVK